jgi:hypothetical protein
MPTASRAEPVDLCEGMRGPDVRLCRIARTARAYVYALPGIPIDDVAATSPSFPITAVPTVLLSELSLPVSTESEGAY